MKRRRVLVMTLEALVPPETIEDDEAYERAAWKTDYDVTSALKELGHDVRVVGLGEDLGALRQAIAEHDPHVVFNLLEEFGGEMRNVPYVLGYLELIKRAYTGCNPAGMLFATDKAIQRKILRHHRIRAPEFAIFRRGRAGPSVARLGWPLIVKSLTHHGSMGITQASVVNNDQELADRVAFVHEQIGTDAIVERYVHGRELYVSIIGNQRLEVMPIWELRFDKLREGAPVIATEKVKWDLRYQKRVGVDIGPAQIQPDLRDRIVRACKRVYRALEQSGYARVDVRLDDDGRFWVIESNPNPQLSYGEEFAESAEAGGLSYTRLVQKILSLGIRQGRG